MDSSRRSAVLSIAGWVAAANRASGNSSPQVPPIPEDPDTRHREPLPGDSDYKLPNGKSQRDAIAAAEHKEALKDASEMVRLASEIKAELDKAGDYVVPLSTVKKTEDIEKLARRIRSRLKS